MGLSYDQVSQPMKRDTALLHLADTPCDWEGAVNPPVVHVSLYCFESLQQYLDTIDGKTAHYTYGRSQNPTTKVLEQKVAYLEHAEACLALASGMAAISTALLTFLHAGDHFLVVSSVYGPVRAFCEGTLRRLGVETEYFPSTESANLAPRLRPTTRAIYLESPATMTFDLQDLRAVSSLARSRGILTMIDNTWATPLFQQPLDLSIDLSLHSGTKYIAGHSDLLLGLVVGSAELLARVRETARALGGTLSPDDAYLAIRGLRTLPLRMARHQESGLQVARWLQARPEVREVLHPGLESFPGYALGRAQMSGYSSLFGFRLQPRGRAAQHRFVDTCLELFRLGYSWGGYESLILPAINHHRANPALRAELGIEDDLYRTSIGLEDADDLIALLDRALRAWAQG
jgi:cystathionine beta-lyase